MLPTETIIKLNPNFSFCHCYQINTWLSHMGRDFGRRCTAGLIPFQPYAESDEEIEALEEARKRIEKAQQPKPGQLSVPLYYVGSSSSSDDDQEGDEPNKKKKKKRKSRKKDDVNEEDWTSIKF
jgi:hypothetical protein